MVKARHYLSLELVSSSDSSHSKNTDALMISASWAGFIEEGIKTEIALSCRMLRNKALLKTMISGNDGMLLTPTLLKESHVKLLLTSGFIL